MPGVAAGQRDDLKDRRGTLLHRHTLRLHGLRQGGEHGLHPVLHQDLRAIEVGADGEGDGERVGAIGRAGRLHV